MVEIRKEYYSDGKIQSETPYINGKRNGIAKTYYPNGNIECEIEYINNRFQSVKEYKNNNK